MRKVRYLGQKMAPPKWATVEEEKFFQSHAAKYQVCQAKRNYSGFWEPVFEEWFSRFPERLRVFKDVPLDVELTVEQKTEVGKAVEHRRQQIMNKFKNDMGSSKVNRRTKNRNNRMMTADVAAASTSLTPAVASKKSMVAQIISSARHVRGPQATEAFSKLFFDDMVKPTLNLAIETAKAEAVANAAAENRERPDEVKQQVAEFVEEAKKKKKKEWEEAKGAGVADHQVYIDKLPAVLTEFFDELQRLTGLVFTVLMGGPTPAMGGQIDVQSFHVGATEIGNQFDLAYPEFNSGIMRPWKEFVKRVFPVATAKEEGSVWGTSRQPTLEPEPWRESSDGHVSQTPDTSDGAFGKIPRDALTVASSSDILFEPLTSFLDDDDPTLKALPTYPSHSTSASMDLNLDGLSVEGYHEFLRTYVAPQEIPTPLYPIHGPTPPTPKPLTPSQSEIQGTDLMTEDSPAGSHPPPLSEPTSAEDLPNAAPTMTDLITKVNSVDSHLHLAYSRPQPLSESTSVETAPTEDNPADSRSQPPSLSKSTSALAAPFESTSAEAAPFESNSTEAAPIESNSTEAAPIESNSTEAAPIESTSAKAVPSGCTSVEAAPLIDSRSKRVRQISKRNEIANSIGSDTTGSKKRGSSGVNGGYRKKQKNA
ncbi:hypothetical protein DFJ58DRAFT_738534 [Suillus subalutaceus]|uniref:uncharacterized protein n=1 Tax=Suillus subalutaceus TaxID=48586 RepID=UPI001B85E2D3|nr:uncharacterized protein DFJ58DRAFT_738534 [Suillus subalutaceus]KAG1825331.1 hypothetical protein DFJ58DRAFT_738534 [Suillus subalutaceus]